MTPSCKWVLKRNTFNFICITVGMTMLLITAYLIYKSVIAVKKDDINETTAFIMLSLFAIPINIVILFHGIKYYDHIERYWQIKNDNNYLYKLDDHLQNIVYKDAFIIMSEKYISNNTDKNIISRYDEITGLSIVNYKVKRTDLTGTIDKSYIVNRELGIQTNCGGITIHCGNIKDEEIQMIIDRFMYYCPHLQNVGIHSQY